jgi:hypothetical protein
MTGKCIIILKTEIETKNKIWQQVTKVTTGRPRFFKPEFSKTTSQGHIATLNFRGKKSASIFGIAKSDVMNR